MPAIPVTTAPCAPQVCSPAVPVVPVTPVVCAPACQPQCVAVQVMRPVQVVQNVWVPEASVVRYK